MKSNRLPLIYKGAALILTVSLLPGCKLFDFLKKKEAPATSESRSADGGISLCSIDGKSVINKDDFDKRVNQVLQSNPYFRGAGVDSLPMNVKSNLLNRFAEEELLVMNAAKQGIESDAEFKKTRDEMFKLVERSLLIQFSEKKIYEAIQVSESQSKDYFEKNKDRYVKVAGGILVNGVKFDTEAAASAFLVKAKADIKNFDKLAKQSKAGKFKEFGRVSKENNAAMGMEMVPAPIKDAVLALPNIPAVEKVKEGKSFWVVAAIDKKPSVYFEFNEVKPQVEAMIKNNEFRNKLKTEIDKLKTEHKVAINEEFFKEAANPSEALKTTEAEAPSEDDNEEEVRADVQTQKQAPQAA
jgi:hypothetical protein